MSLVSTLAKVAAGAMLAKGVGAMMNSNQGGGGGLGGLLGSLAGGMQQQSGNSSSGGLGDILGSLTGGASSAGGAGGLGGLLSGLAASGGQQGGAGGLGDLLGSLAGGGQSGGGIGGLLDSLGATAGGAGIGGMLNQAIAGNAVAAPTAEQNDQAAILLKAMLNAAKSDGKIDDAENEKILGQLGDISQEESDFVRRELSAPLDVDGFISEVPRGMEQQVYLMSLMAIDLDSQEEARYLDQLGRGLGISQEMSNQIHEKYGAPVLYG